MSMSGTLEEVLGTAYDLYVEGRVDDLSITYYFLKLRHEDGSSVFGPEDVDKLLKMLQKEKQELLEGI